MRLRQAFGCFRWEKLLYLSVSETLPEGAARGLRRHLARCKECRTHYERALRLREACQGVAKRRGPYPNAEGALWPAIQATIATRAEAAFPPTLAPAPSGMGKETFPSSSRRALVLAAAAIAVVCWLSFQSFFQDAGSRLDSTALEARWAAEWNEFVSSTATMREPRTDPFRPAIPHPDPIDF